LAITEIMHIICIISVIAKNVAKVDGKMQYTHVS